MKESVGYTISLNIIIVFIVIFFAFMMGAVSYYKAFKINNVISDLIEKYEGYNELSKQEISSRLTSLGYNQSEIDCGTATVRGYCFNNAGGEHPCHNETSAPALTGSGKGYCVFLNVSSCIENELSAGVNTEKDTYYCTAESYNYIVKTYLNFNIPIINDLIRIPVYTKTNAMYGCYGDNC